MALSLFSCVLASVSFLTREESLCASFLRCSMIFFYPFSLLFLSLTFETNVIYLVCLIVYSLSLTSFACHHSRRYYLPFPDSRLYSIVHISVYTARLSTTTTTIIIIISSILIGKSWTLWSSSSSTSNDFNYCFIFVQYHFFSNDVSNLIRSFLFVCSFFLFFWNLVIARAIFSLSLFFRSCSIVRLIHWFFSMF